MKALQIIETAYRATIEEQDDTVVWFTHAMRGAGAELAVVLRAGAVNYALPGQDASGLAFGDWRQTQPPRIAGDVAALLGRGVPVYVVTEDLRVRGLAEAPLVDGVKCISEEQLHKLVEEYDHVWSW